MRTQFATRYELHSKRTKYKLCSETIAPPETLNMLDRNPEALPPALVHSLHTAVRSSPMPVDKQELESFSYLDTSHPDLGFLLPVR